MNREEFAHALWFTEANGRLFDWGDHGLAMGAYQQHPSWLWDWAHTLKLSPTVDESWNHFEGRLVRAFFDWHKEELTPVEVAMKFHLGHESHASNKDWDADYAARFNRYAGGG